MALKTDVRLDMLAPLHPVRDMRLSGQVIYVGRSSMEVAVRMEALNLDGTEETIMLGESCPISLEPFVIRVPKAGSAWSRGTARRTRRVL